MMINVEQFISDIGGRKLLIELTGLSKGRISQWVIENHIPRAWARYFLEKYPRECAANGVGADNKISEQVNT